MTRMRDLREEDPGVEADLRTLVKQIRERLPAGTVSAVGRAVAAGRDVKISSDRGGIAWGLVVS